jgi:hypothetical protein
LTEEVVFESVHTSTPIAIPISSAPYAMAADRRLASRRAAVTPPARPPRKKRLRLIACLPYGPRLTPVTRTILITA